jgi:5-formyltetrahydrofolate cyclo-ligase
MTKKELRTIYKQKRKELDERSLLRLNDMLLISFQQWPMPILQSVLSYWPIQHHQEPDVELMARFLEFKIPELKLCYPRMDATQIKLEAILVDEDTAFSSNQLGIMEPETGTIYPAKELDLVFVPLLAFDQLGYRVGYGKGYYDRFLIECKPDTIKLGFSFFEPVERITDTDQFDVPLNYCITPQHIYEF